MSTSDSEYEDKVRFEHQPDSAASASNGTERSCDDAAAATDYSKIQPMTTVPYGSSVAFLPPAASSYSTNNAFFFPQVSSFSSEVKQSSATMTAPSEPGSASDVGCYRRFPPSCCSSSRNAVLHTEPMSSSGLTYSMARTVEIASSQSSTNSFTSPLMVHTNPATNDYGVPALFSFPQNSNEAAAASRAAPHLRYIVSNGSSFPVGGVLSGSSLFQPLILTPAISDVIQYGSSRANVGCQAAVNNPAPNNYSSTKVLPRHGVATMPSSPDSQQTTTTTAAPTPSSNGVLAQKCDFQPTVISAPKRLSTDPSAVSTLPSVISLNSTGYHHDRVQPVASKFVQVTEAPRSCEADVHASVSAASKQFVATPELVRGDILKTASDSAATTKSTPKKENSPDRGGAEDLLHAASSATSLSQVGVIVYVFYLFLLFSFISIAMFLIALFVLMMIISFVLRIRGTIFAKAL
ncbi:unnamed protein product [Soboliphyme baturini]|uniref:Uncharacterized protein n=1 Tax=Soboliphyme baturini TaxID=241478 RepID=A0A183I981_9BILA|nr:unnamed protein product [Soboliphyme baturini]